MLGQAGTGRAAEVDAHVHPLRREGVFAEIHGQLHEPPEVGAVGRRVAIDGGLRLAERHQQVAVGVRVAVEEDHAARVPVHHVLGLVALGVRPVVGEEIGVPGRRRGLGGVRLRFEGPDVCQPPGCPEGRMHGVECTDGLADGISGKRMAGVIRAGAVCRLRWRRQQESERWPWTTGTRPWRVNGAPHAAAPMPVFSAARDTAAVLT